MHSRYFYVQILLKADLLGVLFQQLPLEEGGLDALAVTVSLMTLADDGDEVALLCVVNSIMQGVGSVRCV